MRNSCVKNSFIAISFVTSNANLKGSATAKFNERKPQVDQKKNRSLKQNKSKGSDLHVCSCFTHCVASL